MRDDLFSHFVESNGACYLALFVGVLLENAGFPLPGETVVLAAGFLASPAGGLRLQIGWVILLACVAAVLGGNLGYWLGQRFARAGLFHGRGFLFLTAARLRQAEGYIGRYGSWTVFFARFITGLRVFVSLAAGAVSMPWSRFFVANAAGAILWAAAISLLGYFCGHSWELLHRWLSWSTCIILGCIAFTFGCWYLWKNLLALSVNKEQDWKAEPGNVSRYANSKRN